MDLFSLSIALIGLSACLLFGVAIRIVRDDQRVAVFRHGRYQRLLGPGIGLVIPFLETSKSVDLDLSAPGWRELSAGEVDDAVRHFMMTTEGAAEPGRNLQEGLTEVYGRIRTFMDPDYGLGIEAVRLRGLVRIILSILLTTLSLFVVGGGFSAYVRLGVLERELEEDYSYIGLILVVIPWLLAISMSAHLLWGIIEVLTGRPWNEAPPLLRWLAVLCIGIPMGLVLTFSMFMHG